MISPRRRLITAASSIRPREAAGAAGGQGPPADLSDQSDHECQPCRPLSVQSEEWADGHGTGRWDGRPDDRALLRARAADLAPAQVVHHSGPEKAGEDVRGPEHHSCAQQQQNEFQLRKRAERSGADHHGGGKQRPVDSAGVIDTGRRGLRGRLGACAVHASRVAERTTLRTGGRPRVVHRLSEVYLRRQALTDIDSLYRWRTSTV